jgi:formylglycine-generating enzyme required for sulfatase activity
MNAPKTCTIPAGAFEMGDNDTDKFANNTERPRHHVTIARPFRLGIFPVTVGEYRCLHPDFARDDTPDLPAVSISWHDAEEYCAWLASENGSSWRLPSEAEWEYACRAGAQTPFAGGNEIDLHAANFLYDESGEKIGPGLRTPAGAYPTNAFGVEAMHGNVCEWCADTCHPDYHGAPADGSAWTENGSNDLRVIRGGAWDYLPRLLRSSWRDSLPATTRRDNVGFRLACDIA